MLFYFERTVAPVRARLNWPHFGEEPLKVLEFRTGVPQYTRSYLTDHRPQVPSLCSVCKPANAYLKYNSTINFVYCSLSVSYKLLLVIFFIVLECKLGYFLFVSKKGSEQPFLKMSKVVHWRHAKWRICIRLADTVCSLRKIANMCHLERFPTDISYLPARLCRQIPLVICRGISFLQRRGEYLLFEFKVD